MAKIEIYGPLYDGQRRSWTVLGLVLPACLFLGGNALAERLANFFGRHASAVSGVWQDNLCGLFGSGLGLGLLWLWLRLAERRQFDDIGLTRPLWPRFGGGFLIGMVMVSVVVAIGIALGVLDIDHPGAWYDHLTPTWLLASSLTIVGTFVQVMTLEALFRGWMMDTIATRWGSALAVLFSIIAFTAVRGADPSQSPEATLDIVNLALMAWLLSLCALRDGTLWGAGGLHAAWMLATGLGFGLNIDGHHLNVTPMLLAVSAWERAPSWLSGGGIGLDGSLIMTAVIVAALLWRLARGNGRHLAGVDAYDDY